MIAIALGLALAAVQAQPSPTPTPAAIDAENLPRLQTAEQLLRDRQPQQALEVATTAVASYEASFAGQKRRIYCGMSGPETILYMGMASHDKTSAVAVSAGYRQAMYLKGYALIDLGRVAEARAEYQRVIALAPMHAHFLSELGQLSRLDKDWPRMLSTCETAEQAAGLALPQFKGAEQGFALRCQGYALVEEHRLDDAEKKYRAALAINPNDAKSQGELKYIADQRNKH